MISKLDLYKVFHVVGKSESFSKAAKELYMTQSAVSQAMMQLERELDTRLFNRTSRGVNLTNEGSLLFEYAHSAINLIDAGEEKMIEFKRLATGELKIGVGDTISKYFLLPYLETFHNKFPNIKLKIVNGTTDELIAVLKSGKVDIVICNFPIDDPTLELRPCFEIQDIFVYGDKYKELLSKRLRIEELVNLPLIFLEPKSNSRKYVEDYLLSKGIRISPEFELGSHDLLLEFAKINLGIACVTKEFSQEYLTTGELYEVQLTEEVPKREVGICFLKRVPLSSASSKFVELIEAVTCD
ncbi:LysR family transcriptional regulator [Pontibacillus litoralis]|uniref:LysR family transcriptional regulator n=1 Tax=Pontibacillus litoralis JSM 072002 TaxID=1385512 RepID=A0A0A5G0J9_9BACI|nr:LysR family transcriptional regulator [Pontibacillus litoralis]KGX86631.1 LysR family transcriptional regulator [Pontibacillus litoralis JSM 072002]